MFPASKSSSEHKNGGFRGMEVGDEGVNGLEFKTRIDKDVVFAESFASFGPEFKRTSDGGANGDNATIGGFGLFNCLNCIVWNMEPFGVHVVFFDIIATNRKKSAKTDVEGKVFDLDAFGLELFDEFFGHIKAGGGGGGRTEFFSPDSLVTFDVVFVGVAVKIGRKGNIAVIGDNFSEVTIGGDGSGAVTQNLFNRNDVVGFTVVGDIFDSELVASMEFATIHDVIDIAVVFFKYDEFARAPIW